MSRRFNPPRAGRNYSSAFASTPVGENVDKHPASTAPDDSRCPLLELEEDIRKQIYYEVANELKSVGLFHDGSRLVCRHPLAITCKQVYAKFHELIQDHPLPNIRSYIVQVKDFDFGCVMSLVREHIHFKRRVNPVEQVKIYHVLTSDPIDHQRFSKWKKFVTGRIFVLFQHTFGQTRTNESSIDRLKGHVHQARRIEGSMCAGYMALQAIYYAWQKSYHGAVNEEARLDAKDDDFDPDNHESYSKDDIMSLDGMSDGSEFDSDDQVDPYEHLSRHFNG